MTAALKASVAAVNLDQHLAVQMDALRVLWSDGLTVAMKVVSAVERLVVWKDAMKAA